MDERSLRRPPVGQIRISASDLDEAIRLWKRERAQEQRVDHREDRRGRTHGERHGDKAASVAVRAFHSTGRGVAHVAANPVDGGKATRIPTLFLPLLEPAHGLQRRVPRLLGSHPRGPVLRDLTLEVVPDLLVQLSLHLIAPEARAQAKPEDLDPPHRDTLGYQQEPIAGVVGNQGVRGEDS
ncbi:MAG: hypothetical protein GEU99_12050 [Luteitalea sp.]|nr:hypothetical protein [Luteitalea sp.]